jgi:hypothetical protein
MKRLAVLVDVNVHVARLCLWTAVTNGPVLPLPDLIHEYGTLVGWYWQGKTDELPVRPCLRQIPHGKCVLLLSDQRKVRLAWRCSCRWGETVSELRPLAGLLFVPQVIYEYGEPRWNDIDRFQPNNSEKNLYQYHFFHHKSHMDWPGAKSSLRSEGPATKPRVMHCSAD